MEGLRFDFVRSPGLVAWLVFVLYLGLVPIGGYYILQIFRREEILLGHLENVFDFLTDVRIWSIKHRITYTAVVSGVLVAAFLVLVYWAERLHYFFYGTDPLFSSPTEFVVWITVLAVSGLERGSGPKSLLGIVLVGVFPIFIIGSVVTIVRYTSEDAHDRLVERMAKGALAPYRVVVLNYQGKYDEFVRTLLEESEAFIVLFPKAEHLADAESLKDSFETTSRDEYRVMIEELSYSTDLLFDQYNVLDSEELYVLPDMDTETDYRNLQLVTTINDAIKRREEEQDAEGAVDCPATVWHTNDAKIAEISSRLSSPTFQDNLHAMNFQADVDDLVRVNLGEPIRQLNRYFNLSADEEPPEWVRGYDLDNYEFAVADLTDAEFDSLAELHRKRARGESNAVVHEHKRTLLADIETRLAEAVSAQGGDHIGPFYGVLADIAGARVPLDPATAYDSYQFETAREALQIRKSRHVASGSTGSLGSEVGDIFVVNYNDHLHQFVRSCDEELAADEDREVVVCCSEDQVTPETTDRVRYVNYETVPELLDFLFHGRELDGVRKEIEPGDAVGIFLDHGAAEPQVDALMILNGVDEKLGSDVVDTSHNDILLAVESSISAHSEEFRYLSVDKVIETFKTQNQFLNNLARLWTSDAMRRAVHESAFRRREAFDWAVRTAHYFRQYQLAPATDVFFPDDPSESVVGHPHHDLVADLRKLEGESRQPFVGFELTRDHPEDVLTVELRELTLDAEVGPDEFLTFLPYI